MGDPVRISQNKLRCKTILCTYEIIKYNKIANLFLFKVDGVKQKKADKYQS